jgi:hypothetical protein
MKTTQTNPVGTSMFRVRCWMFNVAVFATAASALAEVHYVDLNSTTATPPYTNWTTAATNIQDAVDAAVAGEEVVVASGLYYGSVRVNKPLNVRSVNGSRFTTIYGGRPCAYLANDATLSGFALRNGVGASNGCGVWCESLTAVVSNCVVFGNTASETGGGAYGGTLNNCLLSNNSAGRNGGGAAYCTLNNCVLAGNSATYRLGSCQSCPPPNSGDYGDGGGAYNCTLVNCTLTGNSANNFYNFTAIYPTDYGFYGDGGGAAYCTLLNCILDSNVARNTSGYPEPSRYFGDYGRGGGAYSSWLLNCVVFSNGENLFACPGSYVWVTDPLFVDANLRLQPNSPCINAGDNSSATGATDLDGNPRISGGVVDIGAYEFQWPQLTIAPSGPNVVLTWPTNNAGYDYTGFTLRSTTNLGTPVWTTNSPAPTVIAGQNTVTNPITGAQRFYRLVQ